MLKLHKHLDGRTELFTDLYLVKFFLDIKIILSMQKNSFTILNIYRIKYQCVSF